MLDSQTVDNDKPFEVDGYELMFPGDASAPGYLVYNCRCTMIAALDGLESGTRRARDPNTGEWVLVKDMSYAEWAGWKQNGGKAVLNDLNGLKRPATIESVNKVKALPSSILDASGQEKLQQAHKDLLQEVIRRGGLSEVARCYDLK